MNDVLIGLARRGKVMALAMLCGTLVALVHREAATAVFASLMAPLSVYVGTEAYAASKNGPAAAPVVDSKEGG